MSDKDFKVTFYGVRGSIPTPATLPDIRAKLLHVLERVESIDLVDETSRRHFVENLPPHLGGVIGGNSSCVYVKAGDQHFILDGGSGLRVLGFDLLKREFGKGKGHANILFSHTHWDHIMGIPFFGPLYVPGNRFTVYGVHADLEDRLRNQQDFKFFPISFDYYASDIDFVSLKETPSIKLGDVVLSWKEMDHPGGSYSYRLEYQGRSVVFSTDSEYRSMDESYLKPTVDFFDQTDLLIFDAQYTMAESKEKEDWGHSSTFFGIDLALRANVKNLAFFHHEPTYSDFKLNEILESSREFLGAIAPDTSLKVNMAIEGQTFDLMAN